MRTSVSGASCDREWRQAERALSVSAEVRAGLKASSGNWRRARRSPLGAWTCRRPPRPDVGKRYRYRHRFHSAPRPCGPVRNSVSSWPQRRIALARMRMASLSRLSSCGLLLRPGVGAVLRSIRSNAWRLELRQQLAAAGVSPAPGSECARQGPASSVAHLHNTLLLLIIMTVHGPAANHRC